MALELGVPLMPWQRLVADVAGEYDPSTGVPFYREVWVTVPRQSGKTTLDLAVKHERLLMRDVPQVSAYTAQTGADAREKMLEDQVPMLRRSALWGPKPTKDPEGGLIGRVVRRPGAEAVEYMNGSRLITVASGEAAGHGKTIHHATIDEAFADKDMRRPQSLLPAMITVDDAQVFGFSTAGTDASVLLNAKIRQGRKAVDADLGSDIAYFEWSAPPGTDIDDEEAWWACMPALGYTIGIEAMRATRLSFEDVETGGPDEFRRAFMNIPTVGNVREIPPDLWEAVNDDHTTPAGELAFAVECTRDRSSAAIAVADSDGSLELVDHRSGTGWVVGRTVEVAGSCPVFVDKGGPAGVFADQLESAGVTVVRLGTREFTQACGAFYDAIVDRTIRVRAHPATDLAVAAAAKRQVGETWAWARKVGAHDVTPLVAMCVALWGTAHMPETADVEMYVGFS